MCHCSGTRAGGKVSVWFSVQHNQFFDKMKELFSGSSADGSFMQDPFSAAEVGNDDKEKEDMMNGMCPPLMKQRAQ